MDHLAPQTTGRNPLPDPAGKPEEPAPPMKTCDPIYEQCSQPAVPCIKGWTNTAGEILQVLCQKHEQTWHRENDTAEQKRRADRL
jgi:hypothetical protein